MARSVFVDGAPVGRVGPFVTAIAPCDDGRTMLIAAGDRGVALRVWRLSLDDGAVTAAAPLCKGAQMLLARTAERAFWVNAEGETVWWRDLATGLEGSFAVAAGARLLSCAPDGRHVAVGDYNNRGGALDATVLRADDGAAVLTREVGLAPVFTDDGRAVIALTANRFALSRVRLDSGAEEAIVPGERLPVVWAMRVEQGGARLVLDASGRTLVVIDLEANAVLARFAVSRETTVHDAAQGRVLMRERIDRALVTTVRSLETGEVKVFGGDSNATMALTRDGAAIVRARGAVIERIDAQTGAVAVWSDGHEAPVLAAVWSPDGTLLASLAASGVVRVFDAVEGALVWELETARGSATAIAFSPDGRLLYALGGTALVAWALSSGIEVMRRAKARQRVLAMSVAPDGRHLITVGQGMPARVLDLATGERVRAFDVPPGVTQVRFASDERVWLGAPGWPRPEGQSVAVTCIDVHGRSLASHRRVLEAGARFAALDDAPDALVTLTQGRLARVDLRVAAGVSPIAVGVAYDRVLCARARVALCANDDDVTALVSLDDGRVLERLPTRRPVSSASFAPDGRRVALVYRDDGVEVCALGEGLS
jgi:sugar lactone lactonase YvrE